MRAYRTVIISTVAMPEIPTMIPTVTRGLRPSADVPPTSVAPAGKIILHGFFARDYRMLRSECVPVGSAILLALIEVESTTTFVLTNFGLNVGRTSPTPFSRSNFQLVFLCKSRDDGHKITQYYY